ncbi:Hemerythrin HHE cation binding domain-containing protein [Nannocystis exedens]|uniref:Hemerythrin HHE cation binding domain-containing protein n=1 Tax=Nannocystis exedens TaxID=54 RepID=A0A1I2B928_9BACT|nr:hemerythrin domain-containing protein [Nannocystis exedens]PCC68129.1 hypothetical protein NAEX_01138 [Nannocystis exedens]SFE52408.1 Hemerythrin HHE cation binding domain-containing protein [Nannocystis exedens]
MPSIFDHLQAEHQRLRQSLVRLRVAEPGGDPQQCFYRLLCEYTAYARAEEHVLYSYLIHIQSVQQRAIEGLQEHERLDELLREAERVPWGDARRDSTINLLCEAMSRHLREEERDLLAPARRMLSDREAAGLGACFVAERTRVYRDLSRLDEDAKLGPRRPVRPG